MACVNHPDVQEVTRCDNCRRPVCADCFVMLDGRKLCGRCKSDAVRRVERGGRLESGRRSPSPWEKERSLQTLFETARQALLTPKDFFSGLALEGSGFWSYVLALGWPSALLGGLIGYFFPALIIGQSPFQTFGATGGAALLAALVILAPLQIMIGIAIQAGILHLFLRMMGGATARLETTARAVAYAQSVLVFNWVPIIGPFVSIVWVLVLIVVGVREMHGTTTWKVLAALFLPLVLCFGFLALVIGIPFLARLAR